MDDTTIQRLNAINRQFYATTADDFDETRGRAWAGWERLAEHLAAPLVVLDVGCGNGRFGIFLGATFPDSAIIYHGLDNNPSLLGYAASALATADYDHMQFAVEQNDIINDPLPADQQYGLVVLFGVIHHIPGYDKRQQFMQQLAQRVAPGGLLCFAAWRFYDYERFRERLVAWDDVQPDLAETVEQHDYLLDWRRGERALRYCHYVDEDEHAALIAATGLDEIVTYRADGSDGEMNRYSILRR